MLSQPLARSTDTATAPLGLLPEWELASQESGGSHQLCPIGIMCRRTLSDPLKVLDMLLRIHICVQWNDHACLSRSCKRAWSRGYPTLSWRAPSWGDGPIR
jgi:hypothetical protein